jgi:peptidoglycan hydrolase-like protein with peptidoglycan-binding domain
MLRLGSSGDDVRALQRKLKAAGFNPGAADGVFGPATQAALISFQRAAGVAPDGVHGPQTSSALNNWSSDDNNRTRENNRKAEEYADEYGYAQATLNAVPELKNLFRRAIANNWTPEKFQTEVKQSKWYKQNGEAARAALLQRTTDPGTWKRQVDSATATVQARATQMGALINPKQARRVAENMIKYGWNDAQLQSGLQSYIRASRGQLYGAAAAAETEFHQYAMDMGVNISNKAISAWASRVAGGQTAPDSILDKIRKMAGSAYPQFRERIEAGETMAEIADPYVQQMASTLELSPEALTLKDRSIQNALNYRDPETKKATQKSLWQFNLDLRKDDRFAATQGAQDQGSQVLRALGDAFGKTI